MSTQAVLDFSAIKERQKDAWSTGNYSIVGNTLQIVGESLCEALDLRAGSRVLDVAAGNGNATLAAARRFCNVVSTDFVPSLLEAAKVRADAEGQTIDFREADAENLPFAGGSFDVALSTFGVMFAPDQNRAAAEMLRVVRPGGRIGLANWTPESLIGRLFETIARYSPPPPGVLSPALWGTRGRLEELFGGGGGKIVSITERRFQFRYRSSLHWVQLFRTYYGPLSKFYAALEGERLASFSRDVIDLLESANQSDDETLVAPSEYLEVVIERKW